MKTLLALSLLFCTPALAQDLVYFRAFGSKIYFAPPDSNRWELEQNSFDSTTSKHVLMFKSTPLLDSLGREIQPVLAIIAESVNDSMDVIAYSFWKRRQVPFEVTKVLTHEQGHFSFANVIGYEGSYKREDVVHKVLVVHMRHKAIGLMIVCDSTDGVYDKVETAMRDFIHAVGIDQ